MPKYVTIGQSEDGRTHLYPAAVVDTSARSLEDEGRAHGPAYCGYHADKGVAVYSPVKLAGETDNQSPNLLDEYSKDKFGKACPECRSLAITGMLTDPDWQKRFREEELTDA